MAAITSHSARRCTPNLRDKKRAHCATLGEIGGRGRAATVRAACADVVYRRARCPLAPHTHARTIPTAACACWTGEPRRVTRQRGRAASTAAMPWVRPALSLSAHRATAWNELAANRFAGGARAPLNTPRAPRRAVLAGSLPLPRRRRAHARPPAATRAGRLRHHSHFVLQSRRSRVSLGSVTSMLTGLLTGTSNSGGAASSGTSGGGSGSAGVGSGTGAGGSEVDSRPYRIILRHSNGRVRLDPAVDIKDTRAAASLTLPAQDPVLSSTITHSGVAGKLRGGRVGHL